MYTHMYYRYMYIPHPSVKVSLLFEKPSRHHLKIVDHGLTEVVKLSKKDVVESVTVLPDLLCILLL